MHRTMLLEHGVIEGYFLNNGHQSYGVKAVILDMLPASGCFGIALLLSIVVGVLVQGTGEDYFIYYICIPMHLK